jgi:hypothetical protein
MIADSEARAALRSFWIPAAEPSLKLVGSNLMFTWSSASGGEEGLRKMATKEEIQKAAIEMHDWMQQRAIAGLRRDLPARPRAKVGIPSEEREEIYRRFPHFTRKDYSAFVTELQKLVKAALDQTKD